MKQREMRVAMMGKIRGSDMTDRRPGARRVDEELSNINDIQETHSSGL